MKKLIILVLALLMTVTVVGCGDVTEEDYDLMTTAELIQYAKEHTNGTGGMGSTETTGTPNFDVPAVGYDGSKVSLKFYHTMGENLSTVLDTYVAEFNKLYPNIEIVHSQVGGYDDVKTQISTELTVGDSPNIAYCYPDHVAAYKLTGAVASLDNLIASTTEVTRADGSTEVLGLTQAQIDDFIKGYYDEGKSFGDGLMYTLPFSKSTEVLYYNKTFFEANGLSVPTHWFSESEDDTTSLEYVCAKILEIDPECKPLGYDSEANLFITMCEQLGSQYTTAVGKDHYLFNNVVNKSFANIFRGWYKAGWMTTQNIHGSYTSGLFVSQTSPKSYMSIGSSAGATHQRPAKVDGAYPFEVGIATLPQMNPANPKVISQGPSVCIFKKANPQETVASWLFIKYLTTSVQFQASFSMASGYVPVLKSVGENAVYKTQFLDKANGGDFIAALSAKVCLEQEKAYYTSPAFNGSSKARDEVGKLLTKVISTDLGANPTDEEIKDSLNKAFREAVNNCEFFS